MIDLHIHSHYSDGQDSYGRIDSLAVERGVSVFCITDHNFVAPEAGDLPLQGVEISSVDRATGASLHMLGYFRQLDREALNSDLAATVAGYNARARRIIVAFNERYECGLDFEQIMREIVPATFISRNALAARLRKHLGESAITIRDAVREAFVPGEDDSWMMDSTEAITLIERYGGAAVLAHPCARKLPAGANAAEIIGRLSLVGLRGIEVYYPGHDEVVVARLTDIARQYNLVTTVGSDWHGADFSRHAIGMESSITDNIVNQLF